MIELAAWCASVDLYCSADTAAASLRAYMEVART
jgi:hypothetical protein